MSSEWTLFAHPLFLRQLETLADQVQALKARDPVGYTQKNTTKRLAAIYKLAFEVIPQDPTRVEFRQGNALGEAHKHWFRAKFKSNNRSSFRINQSFNKHFNESARMDCESISI
mgnify:CR=1 FL=1